MCADQNFVRSAALGCIKVPSGAGKTEIQVETVFSCRFVATEFSTWGQHAGRIDTLGLSEDGNPVIVEYKKVESSELINQSLY